MFAKLNMFTLLLAASIGAATTTNSPLVRTNNGDVCGRIIIAANGKYAQEFLNIPYAQPPVGPLRFRAPHPVKNWNHELDGTKLGKACVQTISSHSSTWRQFPVGMSEISEDCLSVNIHTPYFGEQQVTNGNASLLPVMVWIHGGSFRSGSNSMALYNASILASEINAIVVTVNYRLGALGFFTLEGIDGVSGNQGLLDQALAIKWVHDNARHFGGDPEQITLFGESAGSASVHYHTLSPVSRDLFTRSIMQSGSASLFWSYRTPERARQASRDFGKSAGCSNTTNDTELFQCFQSTNVSDILAAYEKGSGKDSLIPTTDGIFLTKSPVELLMAGEFKRTPLMIGTTANESMLFFGSYWPEIISTIPDVRLSETQFEAMLAGITYFLSNTTRDVMKLLYSRNASLDADRWRTLNSVFDDCLMNIDMINVLNAHVATKVPAYRYRFDHISSLKLWGVPFDGAVHGDDIPFFFGHPLDPQFNCTKDEVELSRKISQFTGNFARSGNPTYPTEVDAADATNADDNGWKPYSGNLEYFTLDSVEFGRVGTSPEQWRVDFWNRIVPLLTKLEKQANTGASCKVI